MSSKKRQRESDSGSGSGSCSEIESEGSGSKTEGNGVGSGSGGKTKLMNGSVVWGKIAGHPWWPAVFFDSWEGKFSCWLPRSTPLPHTYLVCDHQRCLMNGSCHR